MDRISFKNLKSYATFSTNKKIIRISLNLHCDLEQSGTEDDLAYSVDYAQLAKQFRNECQARQFQDLVDLATSLKKILSNASPAKFELKVETELQDGTMGIKLRDDESNIAKSFIKYSVPTLIGIYPNERQEPQPVIFHVELDNFLGQLEPIVEHVTGVMKSSKLETLEALAHNILASLFSSFPLSAAKLSLTKPCAIADSDGPTIQMTRKATDFGKDGAHLENVFKSDGNSSIWNHRACIAFGSNIEPRILHINKAINRIQESQHMRIIDSSFLYENAPFYDVGEQLDYYNGVIEIETPLNPLDLLSELQKIEIDGGRIRTDIRNESRTIDLDIIYYDDIVFNHDKLVIPHPKMQEREFVLRPLAALECDPTHPIYKLSSRALLHLLLNGKKSALVKIFPSTNLQSKIEWGTRTYIAETLIIEDVRLSPTSAQLDEIMYKAKNLESHGIDLLHIAPKLNHHMLKDTSPENMLKLLTDIQTHLMQNGLKIPVFIDVKSENLSPDLESAGAAATNKKQSVIWKALNCGVLRWNFVLGIECQQNLSSVEVSEFTRKFKLFRAVFADFPIVMRISTNKILTIPVQATPSSSLILMAAAIANGVDIVCVPHIEQFVEATRLADMLWRPK